MLPLHSSLKIPQVKANASGHDFSEASVTTVGFEGVYVTSPTDTAATINAKLSAGLHVVLSPAVYQLDAPLELNKAGQVLLGLGMATLASAKQNAVIKVGNVDGVRICSLIAQAGPPSASGQAAPVLIEFGDGTHAGSAKAPSFMHDVFARVGGPNGDPNAPVAADTMVKVGSGFVIGDNMWFWRADHVVKDLEPPTQKSDRCANGLVVTADDVIMYGLAVEHTEQDLVQWSGERGRTYFYQSEVSPNQCLADSAFQL